MCSEMSFWWVFPLFFFGMMIFCMAFFGRRGRRFDEKYSRDERIRRMEEEIKKLKGGR